MNDPAKLALATRCGRSAMTALWQLQCTCEARKYLINYSDSKRSTDMKRGTASILLLSMAISVAQAQTKADKEAVQALPQAFTAAFNRHDGHQLAQIMADDVDFVTVGAMWLHGRPDFEQYHTRLLNGRFDSIRMEVLRVAVRFLRPDIAIVHWSWTVTGDKNPDGTARKPRYGMMTMVAEKRQGSWLVVASQNDNAVPWSPAEGQMPNLAMPIPGPDQERR